METPEQRLTDRPLEGILVLDLSRLLPGPYCTQLLADLGADVIKIETPLAGDYARMAPEELGFGGVFEAVNRGKRSIAVDYRRPAGRDIVLRLAETADVFIESSRPGQMDKRGLGEADVRAVNPDIVYCSLSGYGQTGPYRDKPGHDVNYLATTGVLSLLGSPDEAPVPPALQLADISAGTLAALRILAALLGRERGGTGRYLDVALVDAAISWLDTLGSGVKSAGTAPTALSGAYPCYRVYQAADGAWLAVGALEVQFWAAFCRGLGRDDLVAAQFDPGVADEIATILASCPADEWLAVFDDDACVSRVNLPSEAQEDPHLSARHIAGAGSKPAPVLGADTREVLDALGLDTVAIDGLEKAGVASGVQTPQRAARAARLGSMLARMAERDKVAAA